MDENTKFSPGDTRFIGYCAVFKVRKEAVHRRQPRDRGPLSRRRYAGLSKLNSMLASFVPTKRLAYK